MLRLVILIIAFSQLGLGYYAGRLDTFEDVGNRTPQKGFSIDQNVYFELYFDINNTKIVDIKLFEFSYTLWNGSNYPIFSNGDYNSLAVSVNLIVGDPKNNYEINAVLNLNHENFPVDHGKTQKVKFKANLHMIYDNRQFESYLVSNIIEINNNDDNKGIGSSIMNKPFYIATATMILLFSFI